MNFSVLCRSGKAVLMGTAIACAALWSSTSYATRMVIDFAADDTPPDVGNTGESFTFSSTNCAATTGPDSCVVDLTVPSNPSSGALSLGFNIKIGAATYGTVFVNENGILTFGSGLTSTFVAESSFTDLVSLVDPTGTRPFVAPLYGGVLPGAAATVGDIFTTGGILYGRGNADPAPNPDPTVDPFLIANVVPAFHVFWIDVSNALQPVSVEVIFYSKNASGDFDMRIRYGQADGEQYNVAGKPHGQAGFVLGGAPVVLSDLSTTPAALKADTDYLYHFCGGVISTTPTCAVVPPPPPQRCDVDGDKDVDLNDLLDIARAFGHKASSKTDPRDADGNLVINLKDLLKCIDKCTRKYCAFK
jgi:hypothetical protein